MGSDLEKIIKYLFFITYQKFAKHDFFVIYKISVRSSADQLRTILYVIYLLLRFDLLDHALQILKAS